MTTISANDVKELRERTGAGMMDCKKALSEAAGDMEAAIDWLRAKGLAAAAKKAGRTAAEGLVCVLTSGTKGAAVEVNAETDFVSRNDKFQAYVRQVTDMTLTSSLTTDALASTSYPGTSHTVTDELTNLIAVIGENMNLRRAQSISVSDGVVISYVHNALEPGSPLGRIGVVVALESTGDKAALTGLARQIGMHIAAANPQACRVDELDAEVVNRERKIFEEQALASGKKPEFVEKMVDGRIRKFYEEAVLAEQVYMLDDTKRTVGQVVTEFSKEAGAPVALKGYIMFRLGEGIEKEQMDFAAEVASMAK